MKDIHGNDVAATLYESYLSKAVIEARSLYQDFYFKIAHSIIKIIEANHSNDKFNRILYSIFTLLNEEFEGYTHPEKFLQNNFDIHAATQFQKYFFELAINHAIISSAKTTQVKTLSELAQSVLAKKMSSKLKLLKYLDPIVLAKEKSRGRIPIEEENYIKTNKLGITALEYTPVDLLNYFAKVYVPAQNQFKRDFKSKSSHWFQAHNLPFVSGISGTMGTCFAGLISINTLSPEETKLYLMMLICSLVSRGHHSFAEAAPIYDKVGFKVQQQELRGTYYAQFLTKAFIKSQHYNDFLKKITCTNEDISHCIIKR